MATRPLAVVVGSIGKLPLGGHTVFVSHHIAGLQELGYDVHYVERLATPDEAYDPRTNEMTDDPSYALDYLRTTLARRGIDDDSWTFVDIDGEFHGADRDALERAVGRADFVLNVTDPVWLDELGACDRRAYIDGDPMFTQVAMETGVGARDGGGVSRQSEVATTGRAGSHVRAPVGIVQSWQPVRTP